ncbi:MAG: polyhydroxyalkanoic acid system family protein [Pseudomonadota bacterium]
MSRIHIVRPHNGDKERAREAIEEAALHISESYGVHYEWEGDHIHFSRPGVDGVMRVGEVDIEIDATLGMFLAMLKAPIEREIGKELDKRFA